MPIRTSSLHNDKAGHDPISDYLESKLRISGAECSKVRQAITCSQCGAPLTGGQCTYCGSVFETEIMNCAIKEAPPITQNAIRIFPCSARSIIGIIRHASVELKRRNIKGLALPESNMKSVYVCRLSPKATYFVQKTEEIDLRIIKYTGCYAGEIGFLFGVLMIQDDKLSETVAVIYGCE